MSFNLPPDPDGPTGPSPAPVSTPPRGRSLLISALVVGVVVIAFWIFAGFYTDLLWFRSVGFGSVFTIELKTRVLLFAFFGVLMGAAVATSCWIAYRTRPAFRGLSAEQQGLDRYRVAIDPYRRPITLGLATLLVLISGGSASSQWQTWLAFRNSEPMLTKDAQFGVDLSFFMFRLPFWRFLIGFGFGVVVVSLIAALVTHYLYGGLRLQTPGEKTTSAARTQIAVLLGLFVALKAVAYWFDRYGLVIKDGSLISGATYTDVNALIPAKQILFVIAIICALLFFATAITRNWLAPGLGFGLLVLSAIVVGGIYPAFVQSVQVHPSEADKERAYIQRNIQATLKAYQLDDVAVTSYAAATEPKAGLLSGDTATLSNVRLIDPAVVSPTFKALQQNRGFYSFADTLDVDRYPLAGTAGVTVNRDAVVAVRELDLTGLAPGQRNFANDHTVYTHGYGLVAAYGNTSDSSGRPSFFAYNIPSQGLLNIAQPRVYFGENEPDYSIVGAPAGKAPVEFDYPTDTVGANGQQSFTYTGKGGVPIGSLLNRALFAAKFSEPNLLLSDRVNTNSKIIWNRSPRDRVQAVAPWLTLDGDSYPAEVNKRIVWIVDGYTTSNSYPYSQLTSLGNSTADSVTASSSAVASQTLDQVNYIRNSVKATVDAYDGTVTLYQWDKTDPVLKVWERAFPGTVQPYESIPAALMPHLRYPQDLFKVQRALYAKYHVTDPGAFYTGDDFWKIPADPTLAPPAPGAGAPQPPYYMTLEMPGQSAPSFSLTTTYAFNQRTNLAAFMTVDSQPGPDYMKFRVLRVPLNLNVPGPEQVQNTFEADPTISSQLSLLRKGGSDVQFGNLLSLPVGGGFLYVEPLYVRATSGATFPLLQKVLVSFGSSKAMDDTLGQALDQVFKGNSGTVTTTPGGSGGTGTGTGTGGGTGTGSGIANPALTQALADAQAALAASDKALKAGDFAAYGLAQQQLADAIARAAAASKVTRAPNASASPSASPSGSASLSPSSASSAGFARLVAGAVPSSLTTRGGAAR